jgi:hypothetical protein
VQTTGGDTFKAQVRLKGSKHKNLVYKAFVKDLQDGTYEVTYTTYVDGEYQVQVYYDGTLIKPLVDYPQKVTCVHTLLYGLTSTAPDFVHNGESHVSNYFNVIAHDAFGNIRSGDKTITTDTGSGQDDAFYLRVLGTDVVSSSAVVTIKRVASADKDFTLTFGKNFGNKKTPKMGCDISADSMEAVLQDTVLPETTVTATSASEWRITFLSHLEAWQPADIKSTGCVSVEVPARLGVYPIEYNVMDAGEYDVAVTTSAGEPINGSPFSLTIVDNIVDAKSSWAVGSGLTDGITGEVSTFTIQAKDARQHERQTIYAVGATGGYFTVSLNGAETDRIAYNESAAGLKTILDRLPTVDAVNVFQDTVLTATGIDNNVWTVVFDGNEVKRSFGDVSLMTSPLSNYSSLVGLEPYVRIKESVKGYDGNERTGDDTKLVDVKLVSTTDCPTNKTGQPNCVTIDSNIVLNKGSPGLYTVTYTPKIKGHYDLTVQIDGVDIATQTFFKGVDVLPTYVSGPHSWHVANAVAVEGYEQTFTIQALDRFYNEAPAIAPDAELVAYLLGKADSRAGQKGKASLIPATIQAENPSTN